MELLDSIRPIISGLIGGIVVWLLYRYSVKSAPIQKESIHIIEYGKGLRIAAILFCPFVVFIDYLAYHETGEDRQTAYILGIAFTIGIIYLAMEAFFVRITFDADTIKLVSPWRKSREIIWKTIEDYRWNNLAQWHVFYTQNDGKIRLSPYMNGTNAFLDNAFSILKQKYPERFTPPTVE